MLRNYKSSNKNLFEYDFKEHKWDEILKVNRGDIDFSFESFLKKFNEILDKLNMHPTKNYLYKR